MLRDRRINYHDHLLRQFGNLVGHSVFGPVGDSLLTLLTGWTAPGLERPRLAVGVVTHAMPFVNWYKVQLGVQGAPTLPCCAGSLGSFLPLGVRSIAPLPPNSTVLVYQHLPTEGVILCALPPRMTSGDVGVPDWIQQGAGTGFHRERCHFDVLNLLASEGGVRDYSAGRPLDATSLDWGWLSETGIGILVSPFQAFLRVNEACGLFLNYFDDHTLLTGVQMDQVSAVHELEARLDEGENRIFVGYATYPWESLGRYRPAQEWTGEQTDEDVVYKLHRGKRDLPIGQEKQRPIYRVQHYPGGYLGQGGQRFVWVPSGQSGAHQYGDQDAGHGVFEETLTLGGAWGLRAAHSVTIAKDVVQPVPRLKTLPEQAVGGDSLSQGNYRFSGRGQGEAHEFHHLPTPTQNPQLNTVAGVLDHFSHLFGWLGRAAYHYHRNDFLVADDADLSVLNVGQEPLGFGELSGAALMSHPTAVELPVDDRYGNVSYFRRRVLFHMTPDGGVLCQDGYGTRWCSTAGHLYADTPGDINLTAGRRVLIRGGDDVSIQAHNSLDLVASNKDLRLKAERNLQALAGNSGAGGMLLESKGAGSAHDYRNKVGEDVDSSGILLKSAQGQVALLGSEIYLRTGGGDMLPGPIVFDADQGNEDITFYGNNLHLFAGNEFALWFGPVDENSNVQELVRFRPDRSLIGSPLVVEGNLTVLDGSCFVENSVRLLSGRFATANSQDEIDPINGVARGQLVALLGEARSHLTDERLRGQTTHQTELVQSLYQQNQLGNEELLELLGFSFRDDLQGSQYGADRYVLLEPLWSQMVHQGHGSGGSLWNEPSVQYQGRELQPFPGQQRWQGDSLLRVTTPSLYDPANGRCVARQTMSEQAAQHQYGNLEAVPMSENLLVVS